MDYQFLTEEHRRNAAVNRLIQLEQEHYSSYLLLQEALLINDQAGINQYNANISSLEPRIDSYRKQLADMENESE